MDKNSKDGVFLGDVLKQEGMKRAETHAHEVWKEAMLFALHGLANASKPFSADDATAMVGMPPGNPNAVGALMGTFLKQRSDIAQIGWKKGRARAAQHSRIIAVYQRQMPVAKTLSRDRQNDKNRGRTERRY